MAKIHGADITFSVEINPNAFKKTQLNSVLEAWRKVMDDRLGQETTAD